MLLIDTRLQVLQQQEKASSDPKERCYAYQAASGVRPIAQANGRLAFIVNAGRAIGSDIRAGGPTAVYSVITDSNRNLITAFPGLP